MHGARLRKKSDAASAKGKKGAEIRWRRDRERRDALALIDPVHVGGRIVRRVVVIVDEVRSKEFVFREHDSERDWRRKDREARNFR